MYDVYPIPNADAKFEEKNKGDSNHMQETCELQMQLTQVGCPDDWEPLSQPYYHWL